MDHLDQGRRGFSASTIIATWFGSGLIKPAPGTVGSIAALPFAWGIAWVGGPILLLAAAGVALLAGIWAAGIYAAKSNSGDPSEVVIDEVAGQWIACAAAPLSLGGYAAAFILFRLFDIWKPWPIRLADRRVKGGLGIMLDDMLAGLAAAILVALLDNLGLLAW